MLKGADAPNKTRSCRLCDAIQEVPELASAQVRVLVVTNFVPDAGAPQRGRWVRDQIDELSSAGSRQSRLRASPPARDEYLPATRRLRRCCGGSASTLSTLTTGCRAGARGLPGRGRCSSASTAPTSATGSSDRCRAASPGGSISSPPSHGPSSTPRTAVPAFPGSPAPRSFPAAPELGRFGPRPASRGAPRARPRPRRPLPALPRQPGPPGEAPRPRRRACRRLRRRPAHRRLDRARADADLGQRRQRGPRHLRLRGLRPCRSRGARLRRPRPLHPGRDRPLRAHRGARTPSAHPSNSRRWTAAARRCSSSGSPNRQASTAPPPSPQRAWRSARSSPTATSSPARGAQVSSPGIGSIGSSPYSISSS